MIFHWQITPIPRGYSGGGLVRIQNTNMHDMLNTLLCGGHFSTKQQLSGIIIEHYRSKHGNPGFIKCVRIKEHLRLIAQFLPELAKKKYSY